ncbi:MAG: hypothetical protein IKE55_01355 [Kiritimatiellae bacterium]|nr:hypothetical protein [Kiritimatiellia bacterium]
MIAAEVRADSWAAPLSAAQMWAIYDFHYNPDGGAAGKWDVTCDWAEKEFELPRKPGREAFYKWLRSMRELAPAHRREVRETADEIAAEGAKSLTVSDDQIISFVKSRALDAATVAKNPEEAERFLRMADSLIRAGQKDAELKMRQRELDLKAAAQQTKDEQLKLAREKFEAAEKRLNAVQGAVDEPQLSDAERVAKIKSIFGMK